MKVTHQEVVASLRAMMGYVENGTSQSVSIGQDDATGEFFVTFGRKTLHSSSFHGLLENMVEWGVDEGEL